MQTKYGNLQGRKSSKTKQIQRFFKQSQPKDRFILPKFSEALAAITKEIAFDQDKVMLAGVQTELYLLNRLEMHFLGGLNELTI